MIRCALNNNSLGSKIVITTRKHDVAEKVGCSYNRNPLHTRVPKTYFMEDYLALKTSVPNNLWKFLK